MDTIKISIDKTEDNIIALYKLNGKTLHPHNESDKDKMLRALKTKGSYSFQLLTWLFPGQVDENIYDDCLEIRTALWGWLKPVLIERNISFTLC